MCGIFGSVFCKQTSAVLVQKALDTIARRGPDSRAVNQIGDSVFGFVRLAILDLSELGIQPMVSENRQEMIVFNGEIYNHHELRKELKALGHVFHSRTDGEVVLRGFIEWKEGLFSKLDGMFAIGIWSEPQQCLFLARDRFGKKPLFFCQIPETGELRFASEIKAIEASGCKLSVNPKFFPALLSLGYVPAPGTLYREVESLLPSTYLKIKRGEKSVCCHYDDLGKQDFIYSCNRREAEAEVRRLVIQAVDRRLESDVKMGALLSGGIDSSIIVGLMAKRLGPELRTFSVGFHGDARFDETSHARLVARTFQTHHTEFFMDGIDPSSIEELITAHDGPFGDSSAIALSFVSKLSQQHVKVALCGDGGDELFCGYNRFLAAEQTLAWPAYLTSPFAKLMGLLKTGRSEKDLRSKAFRFSKLMCLPLHKKLIAFMPYFYMQNTNLWTSPEPFELSLDEMENWSNDLLGQGSTLKKILRHNLFSYLPYDLLVKSDRSSMLHSLELRSPFLDTDLARFVWALPDRLLRRGFQTKWILKKTFSDLLPPEIVTRPKMGFGVPLRMWFRGPLKNYVCDHLGHGAKIREWIVGQIIDDLLREHMDEVADHSHRIWLLLTLEVWLRKRTGMNGIGGIAGIGSSV